MPSDNETPEPENKLAPENSPTPENSPGIDRQLLEFLVCPVTHSTLQYDAKEQELISTAAGLAYPIRDGIPIMLPEEARELKAD